MGSISQSDAAFGHELLDELTSHFPNSPLTHHRVIPARAARHAAWPDWVSPRLRAALEERGITQLFSHQAAAAEAIHAGRNTVIATGTSSGKSLGYQLPVLSRLGTDRTACALYLTPTKALGSDQLLSVERLLRAVDDAGLGCVASSDDGSDAAALPHRSTIIPAPYDGDTPTESRSGIREASRFIFSNPDMVHASLLGAHQRWARVLRHLEFIIIDECHTYRGVFGSHVSLVLRRLLRLCAHYGSDPTIICASATSADPVAHAQRLTGRAMHGITADGSPQGARTVGLWEPGFRDDIEGQNGAPVRRAASTEAAAIMAHLVAAGARTLTFVRSRRQAETTALRCAEELSARGRMDFAARIASYRAGYLAEDRRKLERDLDNGTLLGVATTSALELGIDVDGLDAVVGAGFPGTVASFWQQAGRAGRRGQGSVVVLVARDDPMDTYLVHHPPALLERPIEASVFNPANPYVLEGHIYCAAVEKPLTSFDIEQWQAHDVVERLTENGFLRAREQGWFAAPLPDGPLRPDTAHAAVDIRGGSGQQVIIVDSSDGRLLGTVDSARAASQLHPGAVYLHQGESFLIDDLDFDDYIALARPAQPDYSTQALSDTQIRILAGPPAQHVRQLSPDMSVALVDVEVIDQVTGFMVRLPDGSVAEQVPLDLPRQRLFTQAAAYTISPRALAAAGVDEADIPGSLHAAEHAAIGLLPLLATCDRWDIGGVSTAVHVDTQLPTVFVYDGYPGGAGFAEEGFRRFRDWIAATLQAVSSCSCASGCPSCVQSPKCGNGNEPLNKTGAIKVLHALLVSLDASVAEHEQEGEEK